jgi:hypothetical protein
VSQLPPPSVTAAATSPVAVLVLDPAGVVVAANTAAHELWGVETGRLAGEAFVRLFAFEITGDGPDWLEAQWAAVLDTARDRTEHFNARTHAGATCAVSVRLETLAGLPDRLLATVQPVPAATAPAPAATGASLPLLAAHGGMGFFDLNLETGELQHSPAWKKNARLRRRRTTRHPRGLVGAAAPGRQRGGSVQGR